MEKLCEYMFSQSAKGMRASEIRELLKLTQRPEIISFAGGLPNPDAFPIEKLKPVIEHVMEKHARDAFQYGAPPHGGLAFGQDRLVAILGGQETIRDFIGFPKNNAGRDVMIDAPAPNDNDQLEELSLKLNLK